MTPLRVFLPPPPPIKPLDGIGQGYVLNDLSVLGSFIPSINQGDADGRQDQQTQRQSAPFFTSSLTQGAFGSQTPRTQTSTGMGAAGLSEIPGIYGGSDGANTLAATATKTETVVVTATRIGTARAGGAGSNPLQAANVPTVSGRSGRGDANGNTNPFGVAGNMVGGQVVGTTILLKSLGTGDVSAAINGVDKALGPAAGALLAGQEIYQFQQDVKAGADPAAASVGAAVNGLTIYAAGAGVTALTDNPALGVAAGTATEHALPNNVTTGQRVLNFLGNALYNMLQD